MPLLFKDLRHSEVTKNLEGFFFFECRVQNLSFKLKSSSFELRNSSFEFKTSSFDLRNSSFKLRNSSFKLRNSSFKKFDWINKGRNKSR